MTDAPSGLADTDVYITRSFNAPRALVWRFWTEPEQIATWFGPIGFHVPLETVEIDLRVGGAWSLAMADENGRYPIRGVITELVEEELLVVRLDADAEDAAIENVTLRVQFHDHGEKTRITLHQGPFATDQLRDQTSEGWELSFTKMDDILTGGAA
jgi:uncharacterized protein YndB with AHSA1/START domain